MRSGVASNSHILLSSVTDFSVPCFPPSSPLHSGPPVQYIMKNSAIAPHDFSFTDNYYVFVENRAEGDTLPYLLGNYITLRCATLHYIILHYTTHYTMLNCTTLHSTALHRLTHCMKQS